MLKEILPIELENLFNNYVDTNSLLEIRLRRDYPIILNISNKIYSINFDGLCSISKGIICTKEIIEKVVYISTENSMYASLNQIKTGFITAKKGIRIGVGGEFVYSDKEVSTIKNISYVNIRIPHEVNGCSKSIYPFIFENESILHNTLIISPPGTGKTTILRDLIKQISLSNRYLNVLVIDERYEIVGKSENSSTFNLGYNVDVLFGADKQYGFECGIRSMSPNVICTDEISTKEDVQGISYACNCGVNVIATMHGLNLQDFLNKQELNENFKKFIFKRYVVLSKRNGIGTIEGVYNEEFKLIYRE